MSGASPERPREPISDEDLEFLSRYVGTGTDAGLADAITRTVARLRESEAKSERMRAALNRAFTVANSPDQSQQGKLLGRIENIIAEALSDE